MIELKIFYNRSTAMSVDPRVIADLITDDIHVFNEGLLVIEDLTRREFLQKVSGYTVAGVLQNPAALLQKITTGAVSGKALAAVARTVINMSNDELRHTPEELWLPYISGGRLKQFMAEYPDHFNNEVAQKFYTLTSYLNSGKATAKGTATRLIDLMKARTKVNPMQALNKAFAEGDDLFEYFDKEDVIKAAKSAGISLDYDLVDGYYKKVHAAAEERAREQEKRWQEKEDADDRHRWAAVVHGGVQPGDYLGYERYKSDPRFESIEAIARTLE